MNGTTEETSTKNFVRQRRNLIAISLIVFFYKILGIRFSTINILGNNLEIKDPSTLDYVLWTLLAYLLLRYYQYYRQEYNTSIQTEMIAGRTKHMPQVAEAGFKRLFYKPEDYPKVPSPHKIYARDCDLKLIDYYLIRPKRWQITAMIAVQTLDQTKPPSLAFSGQYAIPINKFDYIKLQAKALIYCTFQTPKITEYYLPFFLPLVPILYNLVAELLRFRLTI